MKIKILIYTLIPLLASCATLENQYQHDADIYRLNNLHYYGELLAEYHAKTDKYPFQGDSEKQIQVSILTKEQEEYHPLTESSSFINKSKEEFIDELSRVLGRQIQLRYDPQRVPVTAPVYYLYIMEGDKYYFVIHLYNKQSFAAERGKNFYHVEITNDEVDHPGFWKFEDLIKNQEYMAVKSKAPYRNGWFEELEHERENH